VAQLPQNRMVYSTEEGRTCPKCGWPARDCRCAATLAAGNEPVPDRLTVRLRLENRASGRHVTVVEGLPENDAYLEDLCRALKKSCGAGGAVGKGTVELQGDHRERLREILGRKGWQVRG
jgi:translation initiation factor 1